MKYKILTILIIFAVPILGQEKFIIKEFVKQDNLPYLNKSDSKVNRNNIFEDSLYIVSKSCSGEWGGTIKFKNKITGIEHSAASTCPVVVNKLNDRYYVTNTLAHLSGFSEILEISNPDSMTVFELPKPRAKKGKRIFRYVGDDESKSTKGTKQLVDSIGVLTLASFPFNGKLYHIVTDFKKTFLTKIEENKFVTIDTVSEKTLWTYNPAVFVSESGHLLVWFENQESEGYLDIFENQITVVRRK